MKTHSPWAWVPSLYFAEGLPYVAVMIISLVMYKRMGISNTEIALYTSWLNLPWVIKPLWSPFIDIIKTKRYWITSMQLLIGAGLAGIAFTIPTDSFLQTTLAIFWLMAFSSATHDIAADGFYMIGLSQHEQALFVGIRSTFYRLATITGQGGLIMLAGYLETTGGNISRAWSITFYILSGLFIGLWLYHRYILPRPSSDITVHNNSSSGIFSSFLETFRSFFRKEQAATAILFMLLYRLPEAQLAKMGIPFLLDPIERGGMAMTTEQIGFTQGTVGVIGLTIGGILGGIAVSRHGLKKWLWPMVWAISLPNIVYVYLSFFQHSSLAVINLCVFIEQFGYGFGFTAYMLYLIYFSQGESKTAHYAICTAFMALGMMLPGMIAGWLQETMGYRMFFIWIMVCTTATFWVTSLLKIDNSFGKK
ncbi:MFS transporter [uncultured Bacteroides sp.]|uniref:MFS transporter n=1 Tax=uncultured Bacteroides sp. TaxID=162156 RepID=UPI002630FAAB|nr:MFS transporter [uncultured Bacteroides sp.]